MCVIYVWNDTKRLNILTPVGVDLSRVLQTLRVFLTEKMMSLICGTLLSSRILA